MSSRIIDICDGMVSVMNGETWSSSFTAARVYAPKWKIDELRSLQVVVAPVNRARTYQHRSNDRLDYQIDVGVFQHVEGSTVARDAAVDALVELVDEIEQYWIRRTLTVNSLQLMTIETETDPVYDQELLRDSGVFASVVSVGLMEALR